MPNVAAATHRAGLGALLYRFTFRLLVGPPARPRGAFYRAARGLGNTAPGAARRDGRIAESPLDTGRRERYRERAQ
jgi:hypothetical protein